MMMMMKTDGLTDWSIVTIFQNGTKGSTDTKETLTLQQPSWFCLL